MNQLEHLKCPACKSNKLAAKYEATYVYSYLIDGDAPGSKNKLEFLPFMFDGREQKEARQYVECTVCGAQYPCYFSKDQKGMDFAVLQKAIQE